jgi:hypothetical protein
MKLDEFYWSNNHRVIVLYVLKLQDTAPMTPARSSDPFAPSVLRLTLYLCVSLANFTDDEEEFSQTWLVQAHGRSTSERDLRLHRRLG